MVVITEIDNKANRVTHAVEQKTAIPIGLSLVIGDAIHNMRSALDIQMYGLIAHLVEKTDTIQFPFARREATLESTIKNRLTHVAGEKVVSVVKALKPYDGGNDYLYGVYALDVIDKHKLILAAASTMLISRDELADLIPHIPVPQGLPGAIFEVGAALIMGLDLSRNERRRFYRANPPGKYERDLQPTFNVVFGKGSSFEGQAIIPSLLSMHQNVAIACANVANAAA